LCVTLILVICLALVSACGDKGAPAATSSANTSSTSAADNTQQVDDTPTTTSADTPVSTDAQLTLAPTPEESTGNYADTIDIILGNSNIAILDPFNPSGSVDACAWAYALIYDRLVYALTEGGYEPYLATSWDTEDYQTFIFHLRDDVYFHNGEKMTSDDVIFTINHAKESVGSSAYNNWSVVAEATAVDEYTLKIVLDEINIDFINNISQPYCGIINEKALTDNSETGVMIGTGAFYISDFVTNNSVEFTRNDNYWSEPAITRQINFQFVPEQSSRAIMMLNGEAQLCFRVSDEDIPSFVDNPDFQLFSFPLATPNVLFFNLNDPITGDYNFRMAVALAIDRDEVQYGAVGEYGLPMTDGSVWGYDMEFRNTSIPQISYDPELAKEYLAKSPYNGEEIEIATAIASTIKASEVIQQQLGRIGIKVKVNSMDSASLGSYTTWDNNQSRIVVFSILFSRVASSIKSSVYPRSTGNRMMYDNAAVNDLIDSATTTTNESTRRDMYMQIQEIIAEDMPYIPLFWRMSSVVAAKGIGGFDLPANALYDMRWIYQDLDA